jgi:hypothetical protein
MVSEWQRQYDESVAVEAERQRAELSKASKPQRAMVALFGTLGTVARLVVLPLYPLIAARAIAYGSFGSVLVGVVLLMLLGLSLFRTVDLMQRRREESRHWLTGLPRTT